MKQRQESVNERSGFLGYIIFNVIKAHGSLSILYIVHYCSKEILEKIIKIVVNSAVQIDALGERQCKRL